MSKRLLPVIAGKPLRWAILFFLLLYGLYGAWQQRSAVPPESLSGPEVRLQQAFDQRQSDLQVEASGVVDRVLPDDLKGSRHQRFILRLSTGQRVLVAHNIDLAPRIPGLRVGDEVTFYGEYEWNAKGGVIHWTHHDPNGRHVDGWLKHRGETYQ